MKTTKTITTLAALAATFISSSVFAESRVWTDAIGKTIEAEQVKVLTDQVILRLVGGREIKVSLDSLSAADRSAAMLNQPPTLELKVAAKTTRSNWTLHNVGRGSRVQIQEESTRVSVTVEKASSARYELPLNTVLYVLGEQGDGSLEVLDKVSETFTYSAQNKEFELISDAFESMKREGGDHGTEYKGWLVTVLDPNGEIIALKSSSREYTENAQELLAANIGTAFDNDFSVLESKAGTEMTNFHRF